MFQHTPFWTVSRNEQRSGDPRENCLIACPLLNSSTVEYEKCSYLKYVKNGADKKTFEKLNSKYFKGYFLFWCVSLSWLFYSVGWRYMFISKILLVMRTHCGTRSLVLCFWSRTICESGTVTTYHLVPGKLIQPNVIRSKVWQTRIDTSMAWTTWLRNYNSHFWKRIKEIHKMQKFTQWNPRTENKSCEYILFV